MVLFTVKKCKNQKNATNIKKKSRTMTPETKNNLLKKRFCFKGGEANTFTETQFCKNTTLINNGTYHVQGWKINVTC